MAFSPTSFAGPGDARRNPHRVASDPPKPTGQVDFSEVNSILRPTLPDGMMWYIRSAW